MIFVTVGTPEFPFDRLMRAVEDLPGVFVQFGTSKPPACRGEAWLDWDSMQQTLSAAEVVVCTAGPGTLFEVWERGMVPVVVPRDPAYGEHVDDHQLRFAATLGDRAEVCLDLSDLPRAIERARGRKVELAGRTQAFCSDFERLVRDLVATNRR